MTERRVSMADVAAAAQVSGQTVSRVVNGSVRVDPGTRARVEAAMAHLGYRPHRAARALRTGRTHTFGVIVQTLATVGNTRMLETIVAAAARRGFAVVVASPVGSSGADAEAAFAALADQGVDGAIVLNEATPSALAARIPVALPVVALDSGGDPRVISVESDHAGGAAQATRHLLAHGAPTVHHLAGPAGSYAANERERGWREALAAAGLAAPDVRRGDWTAASGYDAGRAWAADADVRAIFAANDQLALGVLRALHEAGRAVPEDVAVVGFDDVLDAAEYWPPLSTVRQDFAALGEQAVAALVEPDAPRSRTVVPTTLVVRASSGSMAGAADWRW
ncbi:LacI family DNA-binding transcriptional regulator [Microbacterium sp. LRZ72]|uniref:LacI family DNA-binding transcriptional regulator n=1 Tax=Microbacterium sp. LRZ72 TaxID=2942481 RepID=UPI0029B6CEC4|nr:LacI family DNA-binding transcriptional regulator [Microbacterium sp. LRZ72]MDX2376488.1 LacI family DNA-binding transcriptional regulator [Microbacterium sp. LRZ72]